MKFAGPIKARQGRLARELGTWAGRPHLAKPTEKMVEHNPVYHKPGATKQITRTNLLRNVALIFTSQGIDILVTEDATNCGPAGPQGFSELGHADVPTFHLRYWRLPSCSECFVHHSRSLN
jgi:hypothetical protein